MAEQTVFRTEGIRDDPNYRWVNIERDGARVGKARIRKVYGKYIIKTVNVYAQYERKGIARAFVDGLKAQARMIVAENVRPSARGFWVRMGFEDSRDGNYTWTRSEADIDRGGQAGPESAREVAGAASGNGGIRG